MLEQEIELSHRDPETNSPLKGRYRTPVYEDSLPFTRDEKIDHIEPYNPTVRLDERMDSVPESMDEAAFRSSLRQAEEGPGYEEAREE